MNYKLSSISMEYLVDENNNNMTTTIASGGSDNNNNNNNNKPMAPHNNSCAVQQVVMVSSVSSGSSSSLSSNSSSSCSSTTSGNSSASNSSSTISLANHHHQQQNHLRASVSTTNSMVKVEQDVLLLQLNGTSNKLNNVAHDRLPITTTTNTANNTTTTTTTQAPKPRGRRKKIRTEPIRPICPQCEKQFSNQSALTKHKLTHSDERKFACQQCSKAFKRHDHLTGHMQTHSNRKPFNCTIQGCDKTYCDARSLRRHKENIHHIVTPKEGNCTGNINNNINSHQQQQHQQHQQQSNKSEPISCIASPTTTISQQQEQPTHLLRRRIQRLHSDPGGQFDEPPRLLESASTNYDHHQQHPSQHHYHSQTSQHNHHLHLQQQQAPFSADYASTQHFFDLNQMTPMEQQYCNGGSMPHSMDSMNDSSLGLSVHFEHHQQLTPMTPNHSHPHHSNPPRQLQQQQNNINNNNNNSGYTTPTIMHPPTPTMLAPQQSTPYTPNEHRNYQQQTTNDMNSPSSSFNNNSSSTVHHQPSQLLQKRIQRLRSDPGGHHEPPQLPDLTCRPLETNRRSVDTTIGHHCNQQQASYSADYASTQHFFDLNQTTPMEQQYCNGGSMPHSADSINDSSLGLSVHFEHHQQPTPMTPMTPTMHQPTPTMLAPQQSTPYTTNEHRNYQQRTNNEMNSPSSNFNNVSSSTVHHQPSQLLQKRIQRLRSDPGGHHEPPLLPDLTCRPLETNRRSIDNTLGQQQVSYSADYASTQHFFDLNQMAPMEQQFCNGGSIPHSADSINDSSLGQSVHFEHHQQPTPMTPTTMHPPTPTMLVPQQSTPYTPNEHRNYQQQTTNDMNSPSSSFNNNSSTIVHHQPSQLLQKRIQRLRSDPGGPHEPPQLPDLSCRPLETNRRSVDNTLSHHCNQQQASYSADYASTQHFSFDFNHQMTPSMDQQYCSGTAGSTGTIPPHSADSITDSSVELRNNSHSNTLDILTYP